ncbi:hypothetical protein DL771_004334 [Monosporascus sp. 5C6A]|nr:hypothetical protein DL771_004334 [Monosporascus sp. 5C6A]
MFKAPTFYVLGRSSARFAEVPKPLESLNGDCKIVFIETEVALISGIDLASQQITAAEQKRSTTWAANNKNITFVHNFPGLVESDNAWRLNPPEGASLGRRLFLAAVKLLFSLMGFFVGMTPNEAGERQVYHLTSGVYSPGAWRVHQSSDPVPATKALRHYEATGWPEKIWSFTISLRTRLLPKVEEAPSTKRDRTQPTNRGFPTSPFPHRLFGWDDIRRIILCR